MDNFQAAVSLWIEVCISLQDTQLGTDNMAASWSLNQWRLGGVCFSLLTLEGVEWYNVKNFSHERIRKNYNIQNIQIINEGIIDLTDLNAETQTWPLIIRWFSSLKAQLCTGNVYSKPNKPFYWFCLAAGLKVKRFYCTKRGKKLRNRQELGLLSPMS